MELENLLIDVVRMVIPAGIAIGASVATFKLLARKESEKHRFDKQFLAFSTVMPLKLTAYERALLYLERINPNQLVDRCDPNYKSAKALHAAIMLEILMEYDHNIVQQLYISENAWDYLLTARTKVLQLMDEALTEQKEKATGFDLAKSIKEKYAEWESNPITQAIKVMKRDVLKLFGS